MVVENYAPWLGVANGGKHSGSVATRHGSGLEQLAVLMHTGHEAHLVAPRFADLPAHDFRGRRTPENLGARGRQMHCGFVVRSTQLGSG